MHSGALLHLKMPSDTRQHIKKTYALYTGSEADCDFLFK